MLFSVLTMGNMRTIQHTLPLRLAKHSLGLTEKASAGNNFSSFRHWPAKLPSPVRGLIFHADLFMNLSDMFSVSIML